MVRRLRPDCVYERYGRGWWGELPEESSGVDLRRSMSLERLTTMVYSIYGCLGARILNWTAKIPSV
jgi:hypothetical protein